jgi:hypothetical protein
MLIEVDIILAGHITWTTGRSIAKTDGHATEPDGQVGLTNTRPPALPERWETLRARWACALVRLQRQHSARNKVILPRIVAMDTGLDRCLGGLGTQFVFCF